MNPICDREQDFYGENLTIDRNLIILKVEDKDIFICLTKDEVNHMLTYNVPKEAGELFSGEDLPVVEQSNPKNMNIDFNNQLDKKKWYYKIPTTGQFVNHTFYDLMKKRINSMILKEGPEVVLFRSSGISGIHDYKTETYYVVEAKRCDFYDLDCKEEDLFQGNLPVIENIDIRTACNDNDIERVRELLLNPNINFDKDINYCLRIASVRGYIEIVKLLLENMNLQDKNMVLKFASEYGHIEIVRLLLEKGANVHTNNDYALRAATRNKYTEIVKLLLENGANVHADDDYALKLASEHNDTDIVKILLDYGANIHILNNHIIKYASKNGHTETVKILLKYNPNIHVDNDYPLRWASREGHTEIVKLLLENPNNTADVHAEKDYALRWASKKGHLEIVKLLLEKGANVHAEHNEALRHASQRGFTEMVKILLENGANVRAENNQALKWAKQYGNTETVKLLEATLNQN